MGRLLGAKSRAFRCTLLFSHVEALRPALGERLRKTSHTLHEHRIDREPCSLLNLS